MIKTALATGMSRLAASFRRYGKRIGPEGGECAKRPVGGLESAPTAPFKRYTMDGIHIMEVVEGEDRKPRCAWAYAAPDFLHYHDTEWGFPVDDDVRLFEKLSLEAFQSGLSWRTILAKREQFRIAFHGFRFKEIAAFDEGDVERLLGDAGIVRHRGKIEAVINNARRVHDLVGNRSLAAFVWKFEPAQRTTRDTIASTSPEAVALAKELKRHGWKFVGPTTVYAFMQAMGLVNDHVEGCIIREKVEAARSAFRVPDS